MNDINKIKDDLVNKKAKRNDNGEVHKIVDVKTVDQKIIIRMEPFSDSDESYGVVSDVEYNLFLEKFTPIS